MILKYRFRFYDTKMVTKMVTKMRQARITNTGSVIARKQKKIEVDHEQEQGMGPLQNNMNVLRSDPYACLTFISLHVFIYVRSCLSLPVH